MKTLFLTPQSALHTCSKMDYHNQYQYWEMLGVPVISPDSLFSNFRCLMLSSLFFLVSTMLVGMDTIV
jgi:ABC-type uncharacterized transport system permease subunit